LFICSRTQTSARCTRNVSPSCRKTYSSLDDSGAHYDDMEKVEQVVKIVATTGKGFCGCSMATLVLTDFSGGVQGVFASGWLGCRAVGFKASFSPVAKSEHSGRWLMSVDSAELCVSLAIVTLLLLHHTCMPLDMQFGKTRTTVASRGAIAKDVWQRAS
jgi:hypothetical protein